MSGVIGLGIMLVLVVLVSGCTQQAATPPVRQPLLLLGGSRVWRTRIGFVWEVRVLSRLKKMQPGNEYRHVHIQERYVL